ncbi:hypothetical protein RhiirA5_408539 [Rhizophagus irregularis]|uniref:Zn(2)-C6 fungal-type domain-containing protein n=1 Tax=Rhizophagus irregularis TaxID=588596 RepID=A0A2N0Q7X1_9GLOM|nr:hypothetical protein RhiirA5_408539 [Rhizophagus irregularis]
MDAVYLRPFTNPKRVKLVSTCDVCKNRKVKCDRERPECGTCRKTNRKCSYTYAALTETMRDKQTGMRAQADTNFFQTQLNYLQKMQFGQLYDESGYLSMASRGFGIDVDNSQHVPGMLARPMTMSNVYDGPDDTSILTSEVLQYSSNIVSSIPKDTEQQQYDPYYLNNDNFSMLIQQAPQLSENYLPQTSIPPQQFQEPQQSPHQQMPQQPPHHQPPLQLLQQQLPQQIPQRQPQQFIQQRRHASTEDTVMEDLITNIKNMNLYESTRYIGEGSLLMLDEDNIGEMIIPQMTKDISEVDKSLKILPNEETASELIRLYFKHVHRYFPAIREEIVWNVHEVVRNAPGNLSKPQHLLLLNCIFFIASPFHDDPDKKDGKIYFDRAEALLYEYCTQPHALTVMAIILLGQHNKQMGSRWIYNGIATKMLFELGLHRKFIKVKMDKEVEKMRNEAFWMTFISEK